MRIRIFAAAVAVAASVTTPSAVAAPPTNDQFASAATIASQPASLTVDLTEATLEPGEPAGGCWPTARSAWYSLQPGADQLVRLTTSGPYDRVINLYRDTGSGLGGLTLLRCGLPWDELLTPLQSGATYYVQVGAPPWSGAGTVGLQVSVIDPPANDRFADALTVGSLPYSNTVDMRAATLEPGEPTQPSGVFGQFTATAWYAFTASQSGSTMVSTNGCCANNQNVAVYTGGSVGGLTEVSWTRAYNGLVFTATAGTTYMIQSGHSGAFGGGQLGVTVQRTPLPSVGTFWSPGDPSGFDTVSFYPSAYDPVGIGIDGYTWDFGDGATAVGPFTSHRYAADGDYAVTLRVTTPDGRSNESTATVHVRTRDVAIMKLAAPQAARANQTRTITIGVANRRDAETVTVTLYRSRPSGGWDVVGLSTQLVPGRTGNRTTSFVFSYTFTPDDASIGKVTFRAVATIASGRDALPGDNEAIAPPTIVTS